jgi:hypothetical protein
MDILNSRYNIILYVLDWISCWFSHLKLYMNTEIGNHPNSHQWVGWFDLRGFWRKCSDTSTELIHSTPRLYLWNILKGVFYVKPLFIAVVVRDQKCAVGFLSCVFTMSCGDFQDRVSANLWFTRNFGKVRKSSKCYDKSFCLSEKPFSYHVLYCLSS